jgi:hypothetical protein
MNKKLGSLSKTRKLVANSENKNNIVCDYRTIKQAIKHGLVLKKIHCAIKYIQSDWLKKYIDLNINLRQQAKGNKFEEDFFKLIARFRSTSNEVLS